MELLVKVVAAVSKAFTEVVDRSIRFAKWVAQTAPAWLTLIVGLNTVDTLNEASSVDPVAASVDALRDSLSGEMRAMRPVAPAPVPSDSLSLTIVSELGVVFPNVPLSRELVDSIAIRLMRASATDTVVVRFDSTIMSVLADRH